MELEFLNRADCEAALEELITLKDQSDSIIVNARRSSCAPAAREREVFADVDAMNEANKDHPGWRVLGLEEAEPSVTQASHQARLADLKNCDETEGVAPCKIGEIIIEGATGDPVEVWQIEN